MNRPSNQNHARVSHSNTPGPLPFRSSIRRASSHQPRTQHAAGPSRCRSSCWSVARNRLHLRFQIRRRLPAQLRLLAQRAQHNFIQPNIHLHPMRGRCEFAAWGFAGEQLVEHHAERVDVRAMIDVLWIALLLGCSVARGADGQGRTTVRGRWRRLLGNELGSSFYP